MASLAKLSPPRLFDVVSRERLFVAIDGLIAHPVIWLQGPPGAGKTSLVASYLEARSRGALWYQVRTPAMAMPPRCSITWRSCSTMSTKAPRGCPN